MNNHDRNTEKDHPVSSAVKLPRKPYAPPAFLEDEPIDIFVLACTQFSESACGTGVDQS